jgi:hypothetical protein
MVSSTKIESLARTITEGLTREIDKVRAVHDWIILNTAYDYDNYLLDTIPSVSYRPTGVIMNGCAVCSGYAGTAALLFNALKIPALVIHGKDHAWNMVRLEEVWYHLDVTWDDPVPDQPGRVGYRYFLVGLESLLSSTHPKPECIAEFGIGWPWWTDWLVAPAIPEAPRDYPWDRAPLRMPVPGPDGIRMNRCWFRLNLRDGERGFTVVGGPEKGSCDLTRAIVKAQFRDVLDQNGQPVYKYFSADGPPLLRFTFAAGAGWEVEAPAGAVNGFLCNHAPLAGARRSLRWKDTLTLVSLRRGCPVPEFTLVVKES